MDMTHGATASSHLVGYVNGKPVCLPTGVRQFVVTVVGIVDGYTEQKPLPTKATK